jgi:RsiW-degrading membrane proteinase PrsW (M82 family)
VSAETPPSSAFSGQPTGRPSFIDLQSFVFWVFVVVVGYGFIHTYSAITSAPIMSVQPGIGWLALVLWALYGAAFLAIVYAHQLFVRRSPLITVAALLWGGFAALWFAAQANSALQDIFNHWFALDFNDNWGTAIAAATNEESLKLLGLVALVLLPLARVRSMLDGWFYGAMIGLGFQLVEDYTYTVTQSSSNLDAVLFLFTRGFLGGLWSHAIYTGIAGAGVGYLVSRRDRPWGTRIGVAVGLFAVAWFFHFLWDLPLLNDWIGDSLLSKVAVFLIKGVPALVTLLIVVRIGRSHERKVWSAFVEGTIDRSIVSDAEATALLDRKGRRAARKAVAQAKGRKAGRLQKHLQYAQLRYVQSVAEEGVGSKSAAEEQAKVQELRALIAAA